MLAEKTKAEDADCSNNHCPNCHPVPVAMIGTAGESVKDHCRANGIDNDKAAGQGMEKSIKVHHSVGCKGAACCSLLLTLKDADNHS
jgi:hypothetical protein